MPYVLGLDETSRQETRMTKGEVTDQVQPDNSSVEVSASTLQVKADGIKDTHIDWGTGAGQVSGADVPLADSGTYFAVDDVESALQELGPEVGHAALSNNPHTVTAAQAGAIADAADTVLDTHINWGTGATQVSGADVPLADAGVYFAVDDVESALQELGPEVGHAALSNNPHSVTAAQAGAIADAADTVNDTHIDWGTGANQVSAVDVPIADAGVIITATDVEGALQENRTAIDAIEDNTITSPNGSLSPAGTVGGDDQTLDVVFSTAGLANRSIEASALASTVTNEGASMVGIEDADGLLTATDVEAALAEVAGQLFAAFIQIDSFTTSTSDRDDVDLEIDAAATNNTQQTDFTTGIGVGVDASGAYGAGSGGLPVPAQVTEQGKITVPGLVQLRDATTKDPIGDGSGNEVYGVLFYNTTDSKFYIRYYSDVSGVQTAYTFIGATSIDMKFEEIFAYAGLPNYAFLTTLGGWMDLSSTGDISAVTAGAGLTGGGTSGDVTLDVGAGTAIVVNANNVAVDVGVADGKIPQMDATGYPAADGSQITNVDAVTVDGIDSASFLRSDATDATAGAANTITITGGGTPDILNVAGTFQLGGVAVTSSAAELNKLDGVTALTADLELLSGQAAYGLVAADLNKLADIDATDVEIDQIADGIGAFVTAANLTTMFESAPTNATVTNLETLTGGTTSGGDSLHLHERTADADNVAGAGGISDRRLLYFDPTTGKWLMANGAAVATAHVAAIALAAAAADATALVAHSGRVAAELYSTHSAVTRGDVLALYQGAGGYVVPLADITLTTGALVAVGIAMESVALNTGGAIAMIMAAAAGVFKKELG